MEVPSCQQIGGEDNCFEAADGFGHDDSDRDVSDDDLDLGDPSASLHADISQLFPEVFLCVVCNGSHEVRGAMRV